MKNFLLIFLLFSSFVFAQNKKVNTSTIGWKAYKALNAESLSHYGTVKLKAGNVVMKNGNITSGNFIIDMKSISADDETGKRKMYLENHLKDEDFFDVDKYPTVFFKIIAVKPNTDKNYNSLVTGNLTIKKITKKISFPANITSDNDGVKFQSKMFTFNRKDFGLNYNVFEDMIIKNDVEMTVNFTAK